MGKDTDEGRTVSRAPARDACGIGFPTYEIGIVAMNPKTRPPRQECPGERGSSPLVGALDQREAEPDVPEPTGEGGIVTGEPRHGAPGLQTETFTSARMEPSSMLPSQVPR